MHHGRRRFRSAGVGHRCYEPERVLERLEEYQRDLEQELADVADLIKRLKETSPRRSRSEVPQRRWARPLPPLALAQTFASSRSFFVSSISFCATWLGTSS